MMETVSVVLNRLSLNAPKNCVVNSAQKPDPNLVERGSSWLDVVWGKAVDCLELRTRLQRRLASPGS